MLSDSKKIMMEMKEDRVMRFVMMTTITHFIHMITVKEVIVNLIMMTIIILTFVGLQLMTSIFIKLETMK